MKWKQTSGGRILVSKGVGAQGVAPSLLFRVLQNLGVQMMMMMMMMMWVPYLPRLCNQNYETNPDLSYLYETKHVSKHG